MKRLFIAALILCASVAHADMSQKSEYKCGDVFVKY